MPQLIATIEGVVFKQVNLTKPKTSLGRRPYNDIVLENLVCSGEHCVFHLVEGGDVEVEDLASTNGTAVNGDKVEKQRLKNGDMIGIGRYRIQYLSSSLEPQGYHRTNALEPGDADTGPAPLSMGNVLTAGFKLMSGSSMGLEVPVVKAVTTFGKRGVSVVAVSHRHNGFFVAHMEGADAPLLNGEPLGAQAVAMSDGDILELAGTKMQFLLKH